MARRKKVDPHDVVIDVDVPPVEGGESAIVAVDPVAQAVAALEERAKSVALDARSKAMDRIEKLQRAQERLIEEASTRDLSEATLKELFISIGIGEDKIGKLLDDIMPQRKEARKQGKKQNIFIYEFSDKNKKGVAIAIDQGGDDD